MTTLAQGKMSPNEPVYTMSLWAQNALRHLLGIAPHTSCEGGEREYWGEDEFDYRWVPCPICEAIETTRNDVFEAVATQGVADNDPSHRERETALYRQWLAALPPVRSPKSMPMTTDTEILF